MPTSNFPGGFAEGVSIRGLPITLTHPGKVFWVGNSSVEGPNQRGPRDSGPGTFNEPFSTLDYAVGRCVAGRGDIIFVKPGHAESIASATALVLDVAGIAIVGLGRGSLRPTLTFTTANTASIPVSAANITLHNILFVANFAAVAKVFTVSTADDFTVDTCEFRDTSSILNFVSIITTGTTTADNDGLTFSNNRVIGLGTTAATTPLNVLSTSDRVTIEDNYINLAVLNNTSALLYTATKDITNLVMARNKVYRPNTDTATGGLLMNTSGTAGHGVICDNYAFCLDTAALILVTATATYGLANNLATGDVGTSAYVLPAIGTN